MLAWEFLVTSSEPSSLVGGLSNKPLVSSCIVELWVVQKQVQSPDQSSPLQATNRQLCTSPFLADSPTPPSTMANVNVYSAEILGVS